MQDINGKVINPGDMIAVKGATVGTAQRVEEDWQGEFLDLGDGVIVEEDEQIEVVSFGYLCLEA